MSKSFNRFFQITLALILFVGFFSCSGSGQGGSMPAEAVSPSPSPSVWPDPQPVLEKKEINLGSVTVSAEMAETWEQKNKGLSWRTSLGETDGMYFSYSPKAQPDMWMYGMLIPLDVIWVSDGRVAEITENIQPPSDPFSYDLPTCSPQIHVDGFLEVNAGFAKKYGIKPGGIFVIEQQRDSVH